MGCFAMTEPGGEHGGGGCDIENPLALLHCRKRSCSLYLPACLLYCRICRTKDPHREKEHRSGRCLRHQYLDRLYTARSRRLPPHYWMPMPSGH
jgi:hypothetical protein